MRHVWIIVLTAVAFGCGTKKALESGMPEPRSARELVRALDERTMNYNFLRWKGTGRAVINGESQGFRVELRLVRDSLIWFDIADPVLGIKVVRGLLTADSLVYFNRLEKSWWGYGSEQISRWTGNSLSLQQVQRALTGDPMTPPSTRYYEDGASSGAYLLLARSPLDKDSSFLPNLSIHPTYLRLEKQELADANQGLRLRMQYSDYETVCNIPLGCSISLALTGRSQFELELVLDKPEVNGPRHVPFQIPEGYGRGN